MSSVGDRLRTARMLAGLTQKQLADRIGFSKSTLEKVERGATPASPALIDAATRELRLSPGDLTGPPEPIGSPDDRYVYSVIPGIRRALARPLGPSPVRRTLDELTVAVRQASQLRHSVNLRELGDAVPDLVDDLRAYPQSELAHALLAEVYAAAGQVVWKLGYVDLYSIAVDRHEDAAAASGEPIAAIVAAYQRAGEYITGADWRSAVAVLNAAKGSISNKPDVAMLSMLGSIHLKTGLATARGGNLSTATDHLNEAATIAQLTGERDDGRLLFGPTNVGVWSVGLAVEAMDGTEAVKRAAHVVIPENTKPERAGHHYIDLARGYQLHGDRDGALRCLNKARQISPQQTRQHPQVKETVRVMAAAERRRSDSLAGFARWAGISIGL